MKLKLDENIGVRGQARIAAAGHDVSTVHLQQLGGANDSELARVCTAEGRALVTLDLDFANPLRFPPERYAGIAVLRMRSGGGPEELLGLVESLVQALANRSLTGQLWIVETGRVREFEQEP